MVGTDPDRSPAPDVRTTGSGRRRSATAEHQAGVRGSTSASAAAATRRASEVAGLLDISPAAANSLLQRARDNLAAAAPSEQTVSDTLEPDQQHALDEYVAAFERADIPGLQRMLLADASLEMPPLSTWFSGRAAIIGFWKSLILTGPGRFRVVATSANGQPAAAMYLRHADGSYHVDALHVLTPAPGGIARIVVFLQSTVFELFDLPMTIDHEGSAHDIAR